MEKQPVQNLLVKTSGRIEYVADGFLKARMLTLGIRKGKFIQLIRKSALGKSCYIQVETQVLGMREEEAAQIFVV